MSGILKNKKTKYMGSIIKKIFTYLILPLCIAGLVYLIVDSIQQPVKFNKIRAYRESIAIQRLKDLRDLQVAYKNVNGRYVSTVDSLKKFYNEGKIEVVMQVGSKDDSLAMATTKKVKAKLRRFKGDKLNQELMKLYQAGEKNLVFSTKTTVFVKDTLFHGRTDFHIDSLAWIPFSGDSLEMKAITRLVQGVKVPLFEAKMPYESLLKGMDRQLRINLKAEREDQGRYQGLMVGSIDAPNNNAGNWE